VVLAGEKHREGFSGDVTSSEASFPAIEQPFGKMPLGKSMGLEEKLLRGQRVLDGLAGVRVGGRAQAAASNSVSFENEVWSITAMNS
jgi:hypothetical protein